MLYISYSTWINADRVLVCRSHHRRWCYPCSTISCRYHNNTSAFAALATQSSTLSQSHSALYDSDHPSLHIASMGKHRRNGSMPGSSLVFKETTKEELQEIKDKLGITATWDLSEIA